MQQQNFYDRRVQSILHKNWIKSAHRWMTCKLSTQNLTHPAFKPFMTAEADLFLLTSQSHTVI
jgi:hypothetical protein